MTFAYLGPVNSTVPTKDTNHSLKHASLLAARSKTHALGDMLEAERITYNGIVFTIITSQTSICGVGLLATHIKDCQVTFQKVEEDVLLWHEEVCYSGSWQRHGRMDDIGRKMDVLVGYVRNYTEKMLETAKEIKGGYEQLGRALEKHRSL